MIRPRVALIRVPVSPPDLRLVRRCERRGDVRGRPVRAVCRRLRVRHSEELVRKRVKILLCKRDTQRNGNARGKTVRIFPARMHGAALVYDGGAPARDEGDGDGGSS